MSEPDETIKSWMDVFVDVYAPDQEKIDEASEKIQDKLDNDKGFLIDICTKMLMLEDSEDDKVMKSKSLSSILLSQCLEITSKKDLLILRKNFKQNPERVERIKSAVKPNVFSNNSSIRNKSAQCYSNLVAILVDSWTEGIDEVVNLYSNTNLLPYGYIGLITIMTEIVNQATFVDEILKIFKNQFVQTIDFSMNILRADPNDEKYIPHLRYEACRFIRDIIDVCKQIFDSEEKKAGKIPDLLDSLANSYKVINYDLFSMLNQLLFIIIKKYYEQSPDFIETIKSYIGIGFEMKSTNTDYVNNSIFFWKQVASLEQKVVERNNIDDTLHRPHDQQQLEPLLSIAASEKLLPIFLNFMEYIDENDTSIEDINENPEPYMYSTVAVAEFYKLAPQTIFEKVKERIEEIIGKIENWTQIHAVLLMLYSITDEPTHPEISEYISSKFDLIIEASLPQQVPRLRETALFVIGFAIMNYPDIIIRQDGETTDKRITDIINSIEPTLNITEEQQSEIPADVRQIFLRYSSIIYHLANVWENNIYESKIGQYFEKFYNIIGNLFNFGVLNSDQMLIQISSEALNQLIFNSPPELSNGLGELYKKTIDFLDQSKTQYLSQEIRFVVQSSFCSNISSILLKLKTTNKQNCIKIISTFAQRTLILIYELLSNRNTYIYEQGLMAISALIKATSYPEQQFYIDLFDEETFNRLVNEFIYNGLISLNSDVINTTCILIGNLYYFLLPKIPDLLQTLNNFFNELSKLIIEHKEMRDSHPFILKALADMFNCLQPHDERLLEFEDPLLDLLTKIFDVSNELDITNKTDIDYGNMFYIYLTEAFCGYAKIFYTNTDLEKEKQQLFLLDRLATYIYKLFPKINDKLYIAFARTARMFSENCSRRNNVILNRHSIHRILKLGYENATTLEGKKYIKEVIEFVKGK